VELASLILIFLLFCCMQMDTNYNDSTYAMSARTPRIGDILGQPTIPKAGNTIQLPPTEIAVIGGGIGGSTTALFLVKDGHKVVLIESAESMNRGPPYCHLHAGGCFYREITDKERLLLLEQSILTARLFPEAIDYRPTVIVVPETDDGNPCDLLPSFEKVRQHYQRLVDQNPLNAVFGPPDDYFKTYNKSELEEIAKNTQSKTITSYNNWMVPVAREVDLNKMKYPIIITAEPGWNTQRHSSILNGTLKRMSGCRIMLNTTVTEVERSSKEKYKLTLITKENQNEVVKTLEADYLVNAAGSQTGFVDDILGMKARHCAVEFKSAYISQWDHAKEELWPEVLFHGPRNCENGMAQLTPYTNGVFQLHGMTPEITLFKDGLSKSNGTNSSHAPVAPKYRRLLAGAWPRYFLQKRTKKAITHMSQFISRFNSAKPSGTRPLCGAQQIPGTNADKRATSASFIGTNYARVEIVKASSAVDAAVRVLRHVKSGTSDDGESILLGHENFDVSSIRDGLDIDEEEIHEEATKSAIHQGFPPEIGSRGRAK